MERRKENTKRYIRKIRKRERNTELNYETEEKKEHINTKY
jgi:hypothetical protein